MKKSTGAVLWIGSPEKHPDIRHATGFVAPDPVVLLRSGRGWSLVVSTLEYARATRSIPQASVWTPERLGVRGKALRETGEWAAALLRRYRIRNVSVPGDFPLAAARTLEDAGVVVAVAVPGTLRPERIVKSEAEIAMLQRSQRAAVAGMRCAWELIATSEIDAAGRLRQQGRVLTSERVRERMREAVVRYGCIDSGTIVAGGEQGADPHEVGTGPLRAGEFIVVDLFPRHLENGYWGDLTRTYMRGVPTDRQRAMYQAVVRAQRAALKAVREGVSGAEVHRTASVTLEAAGFATTLDAARPTGFIHGTGHGVGLEIHEAPSLGRQEVVLRAGMVVTVEPGLYYPELGGVRIEDTVVVTATGCERLARCPVPSLDA